MGFLKKIKTKFLDFEHPPKPRTLVIFDTILIGLILVVYALIQHVIPSHYFYTLSLNNGKNSNEVDVIPTASIVLPSPTPQPEDSSKISFSEKFADKFSEKVVIGNNFYKSPNVSIEITEHSSAESTFLPQHWYEADIYVSDIHCLQTFMHDGSNMEVGLHIKTLSQAANSVLAVNGDYALTTTSGVIIRNGEVYRDAPAEAEICVLFDDGTMECYSASEYDSDEVLSRGAWQAWTFGPSLLNGRGKAIDSFSSYYGSVLEYNPRTVIGYYEPGHYCLVVIDGRQPGYAIGYTMEETACVMESLGCKTAFNLDGGRSSQMTFGTEYVNIPYKDGRYVGDIIYVKDILLSEEAS